MQSLVVIKHGDILQNVLLCLIAGLVMSPLATFLLEAALTRIKDYHKAWKSVVGAERQRFQTVENLERMLVITAFVARAIAAIEKTPRCRRLRVGSFTPLRN